MAPFLPNVAACMVVLAFFGGLLPNEGSTPVSFCPPVDAGECIVGRRTADREFIVTEMQLAGVLDWLLEIHDFHCELPGRQLLHALFAWLETLRLLSCAQRFSECGETMEALFRQECQRADAEREEAQQLAGASAIEAGGSTCHNFQAALASALAFAMQVGKTVTTSASPCWGIGSKNGQPGSVDGMGIFKLYPSDRAPSNICTASQLPLPSAESVQVSTLLTPWRDITAHVVPGHLLGTSEALQALRSAGFTSELTSTQWVVNLGAGDGACDVGAHFDPANCLALTEDNYRGIFVEGDADSFQALRARVLAQQARVGVFSVPQPYHHLVNTYLTPDTVVETIAALLPTSEPALLKIDIDNADCVLLGRLLEVFSPLLVHAEINPLFPPPMVLRQAFDAGVDTLGEAGRAQRLARSEVTGCSVAALLEDANAHRGEGLLRYELLHVEFANALLAREDVAAVLRRFFGNASTSTIEAGAEEKWRLGYFCNPLARHFDRREWEARYDVRALAEPAVPVSQRLQWARAWLSQLAPSDTSPYELYAFESG